MNKNEKIKVLVVDDSAVVRQNLEQIINSDPDMEVMGTAADPYLAAYKIKKEVPDVITLDVEMPRMDGITFLRKIMSQHPMPVVIISSLTKKGTHTGIKALESGAVEIITKPRLDSKRFIHESKIRICDAIKAAAVSTMKRSGARYYVDVKEGPLVNRHRPSVDVLFRSVARYAGRNAVGIILTGMGKDGAQGLLEMKNAGAKTIAQDEKSSIVYGMPKEAVELNAVDKILSLQDMTSFITTNFRF